MDFLIGDGDEEDELVVSLLDVMASGMMATVLEMGVLGGRPRRF